MKFIGLFIILIGLLLTALYFSIPKTNARQNTSNAFAQDWTLTDQNGNRRLSSEFNTYKLIYFGFSFCPEICPTELQRMTRVLNQIDSPEIKPIFITIDPERDTPDILKTYIENFHEDFTALTGTEKDVDKVIDIFKVYASKVEDPNFTEYTMDHSSYIYFLGPDYAYIDVFNKDDSIDFMVNKIEKIL